MSDDGRRIFQDVAKAYDLPAFLRRAHEVEAAWDSVLAGCRRERRRLLRFPRLRLAILSAISDKWRSPLLAKYCASADISSLIKLEQNWQPVLRRPRAPSNRPGELKVAVERLVAAFQRFNDCWAGFVDTVSLDRVNRLRADYNRYYVIEKECAVRSQQTAQRHFKPMQPARLDEVRELFPMLDIPQIQNGPGLPKRW